MASPLESVVKNMGKIVNLLGLILVQTGGDLEPLLESSTKTSTPGRKYRDVCGELDGTEARSGDAGDAVPSSSRRDAAAGAIPPPPKGQIALVSDLVVSRRRRCPTSTPPRSWTSLKTAIRKRSGISGRVY